MPAGTTTRFLSSIAYVSVPRNVAIECELHGDRCGSTQVPKYYHRSPRLPTAAQDRGAFRTSQKKNRGPREFHRVHGRAVARSPRHAHIHAANVDNSIVLSRARDRIHRGPIDAIERVHRGRGMRHTEVWKRRGADARECARPRAASIEIPRGVGAIDDVMWMRERHECELGHRILG